MRDEDMANEDVPQQVGRAIPASVVVVESGETVSPTIWFCVGMVLGMIVMLQLGYGD